MTSEQSETGEWGTSRRNYLKGIGTAGMATLIGASAESAVGAIADGDTVSVGSGGYTTAMPSDAGIDGTYATPPSASEVYTTGNASGPVPSNDWWSTIALGTQGDPHGQGSIAGLPYHADTNVRGLTVQYPSDWFGDPAENAFIKYDYLNTPQLTIGHTATSNFADSRADDWGDWHVRTKWGEGTGTTLDATLVKGSPFFFAEYAGGDAQITLETKDSTASSVTLADSGNVSVWADRGNVLGITVDGITADNYSKHYALFAPSGSTWSGKGTATLTSSLNGQGYLTVALLPDASTSTLDLFETYAYNFVRDTTVSWNYDQPNSEVTTTYQFTTENKAESAAGANETLACLFPHQWKHTNAALTGLTYFSPRGELRVHEGSSFTTTMPYRGILPFMPDEGSYDAGTLASYVDDLEAAPFWQNGTGSDTDTYFSGKDLNRTGQGIPIAQQVGDTAARDSFLGALQTRLQSWFSVGDTFDGTAEEEEVFYYHDAVGSLVGYPDGFGSADILNDHHFHYGYMINAAAEVARMDDQWVADYGDMVELVIREYANWDRPSGTAPYGTLPVDSPSDAFPFLRNFDPYSGHSWAGGNGAAADCNNQESSSEAVNAYAGMIKWGEYTGNTALRDAAIYMYTQEVHAIWDYWFDPNHDSFPSTWGDNVNEPSIGGPDFNYASIVWGTGYDHHVFWGTQDQVEIFGINWLPINGHSLYLGWDTAYADGNWGDLIRTRGDDTNFLGGWKTAAWGYRALHNPADAVNLAEAELPLDDTNASGSSSAFTYHWVHNLNAMGTVDTSVTADVPMHAVFDDGGSKTYVAYNSSSSTQTVTFSDGYTMDVPANAQKTSNGNVTEGLAGGDSGGGGGGGGGNDSPYSATDVGAVDVAGSTSGTSSSLTIEGAGADIWGSADEFHYAYQQVSGDVTVTANVTSVENTNGWAKAGVMIREDLTAGSKHGMAAVTPSNGTAFQRRASTGGSTAHTGGSGSSGSYWVRIERSGDTITAYESGDGSSWSQIGSDTIAMTDSVYVGMPVTSHAAGTLCTANFDGITIDTGSSGGQTAFNGPHTVPGVIEAEDFDTGGEGVAYHDTTAGNDGGATYRSSDVDIESSTENGYNICWNVDGEWWEYTVDVGTSGTYDIDLRVASDLGGGSFHVEVDGTDVTGTVSFAATGGWQAWQTVSAGSVDLSAGEHVIRLYSHENDWNINWIEFTSSGDSTAPSTPSGLTSTGTTDSSVDLSWNASSDSGTGIDHYNVYVNGAFDHSVTTTSTTVSGLASGTSYDFQVSAVDGAGNESGLSSVLTVATDTSSGQSAYNGPHTLPGTLQAEDFDSGGSGVAFSDSDSANNGGAYRSTAVDLEGTTEGGYNIGWTAAGEWTEYTVQIDSAGTYDLNARVASNAGGGDFRLEVDGTDVTGTITTPGTGGWQTWQTHTVSGIDLPSGEHVIRMYVEAGGFNLNWLEFVQTSSGSGTSFSGSAGQGWSATVTNTGTDQYEWSISPNNTAGWADVHFADPGTDAWVGYRMDDSDGDNVHLHTRDTSGDGSSIDFRFVWDDGAGGQYMTNRQTFTY